MSDPTRIICLGNSITQAFDQPDCDKWTGVLQQLLDRASPGAFKVFNRGIGGQTAAQGLDRMFSDVVPWLPAVVLVEFGFNDAVVPAQTMVPKLTVPEFKVKMREIHRIATTRGGTVVLIVNHIQHDVLVQGNGQPYEESYAPYEAAIRELAGELKVAAIDLPRLMTERRVDLTRFLAADGIHLTAEGNRLYAGMVFEALKPALPGAT